jgi:hypothetical protein
MTDGKHLAFKLMGYSTSDLSDVTIPLAIILKFGIGSESCLVVYAISEALVGDFAPLYTPDGKLQLFLEDLRKCPPGSRSELLFRHLSDLGVGPIRFVSQSAPNEIDVEGQISRAVEEVWPKVIWPDSFVRL